MGESGQMNIDDIVAVNAISIGEALVAVVEVEAEIEPPGQHNCCRVPVLDFQDKLKHKDSLEY